MIRAIIVSAVIGIITASLSIALYLNFSKVETPTAPTAPQAQKFRFGEQCGDGLRVEYVSTIRLPKSVICQKAVGE